MAKYRVLQGIDYPPNMRAEAGDVVEDLPPKSIAWLLESNIIEPADKVTANLPVEQAVEEIVEPVVETTPEPIIKEETEPVVEAIEEPIEGDE
jgi:hypothetical protein